MAKKLAARDGREAKVYIAKTPSPGQVTSGALKKGHWYSIDEKDTSATALGADTKIGDVIYVDKNGITLGTSDKVTPIEWLFLGEATGKSMSDSKTVADVTCDKDDSANNVCNGIVSSSGTINGHDLLDPDEASGINYVRQLFNKMIVYKSGVPTVVEKDKSSKVLLLFVWDARDVQADELVAIDILPAFITEKSRDAQYGSPQSMNISFTGCDTDDNGRRKSYQQITYVEEEALT